MKNKLIWLSVAGMTFIIGVISSLVWFQPTDRNNSIQQSSVKSESFGTSEQKHICLKRFDINPGDSFQYVNNIVDLIPNPNGENENISWQKGKLTDFYSVEEASIEIDEENRLNPSIFCTFDDQQRLRSFHISWTHEGQKSDFIKQKIVNTLIEKERGCAAGKDINFKKDTLKDEVDFGNYIQRFEYDFSEKTSYWLVSYSFTTK